MCPNTAPILPAPGVGGSFFRAGPPWRLIPMHRILFVLVIVLSLLLVACSSPAQVATAPTAVPAQAEPATATSVPSATPVPPTPTMAPINIPAPTDTPPPTNTPAPTNTSAPPD